MDPSASFHVVLLVLGIVFLTTEIFIPGFGVFGVSGIIMIIAGIIMGSPSIQLAVVLIILFLVLLTIILMILLKKMPKQIILNTSLTKKEGFSSSFENDDLIGKQMLTETYLRPSGKVRYEGKIYDAITQGEFIQKGAEVVVYDAKGYILFVKEVEKEK